MLKQEVSPKIHSIQWGKVTIDGARSFKDVKLFPGGAREWDWNETGTHHVPGIQPDDVQELIDKGAETVILSQGFHERLQVCEETKELLNNHNVAYHILDTEQATSKYNNLRTDCAVGALIHSTC